MKNLILLALLTLTSCATFLCGKTQEIPIDSFPDGANVSINNEYIGTTPVTAKVVRKSDFELLLTLDGYKIVNNVYTKEINPVIIGNLLIGGIPGLVIDVLSGASYKFSPDRLYFQLEGK